MGGRCGGGRHGLRRQRGLAAGASCTGDAAHDVHAAADQLSDQSERLAKEIRELLGELRKVV